ncbi:hypothetical protein THAOC_05092, partial [Thalassiosira oceanica]
VPKAAYQVACPAGVPGGSVHSGQWCVARASDAAPGVASGGLGPQRPHLLSLAE